MPNYTELSKKQSEFNEMTGMSVAGFNALLFYFEKAEIGGEFTIAGKKRKRKHTVYKNSPLNCPADRLLFMLIYIKQNMTQSALGLLFGVSQPKANMLLHYLAPILSSALQESSSSPCSNMEEINGRRDDAYIHDGLKRIAERQKDRKCQKDSCAEKKDLCEAENCTVENAE